jgi:predicted molibdopterin-dependent oxidoreductase YjgC
MAEEETIKLEFNGREVTAPGGITVLRAAELNDIYIPTLCSHKDLSPFGGCRMCLVEIDGIRGYPLACNTMASDGMKVRTDTVAIEEMRRELLQLILSEHPSSCLVCDERVECRQFMGTVRKAGVTTGCRYCPNDTQCELQDLVEKLGITEIHYPILYRHYETERMDPFFDRDYNICILCGRCVRMCQEMRGTAVLAFNYRGPKVIVGPAFGRNHIEAGCEFCGACITVCPTGALAEKSSKWDGKPDDYIVATCPYCAIGCRLELYRRDGKFSTAKPVLDPEVNDGQACVKGRFCMGEVSHHFKRARKPFTQEGAYWKEKTWDEVLDIASEKLKGLKPGEFAMLISPDCTNESLYVAQKFARTAMGTNSIDSTAREALGGGLGFWAELFGKPIAINEIKNASRILAVTLDTRFSFSIVGVEIRKALQKGAGMVTIGPRESNLARYAEIWLQPTSGYEGLLLQAIAKGGRKDIKDAATKAGIDPKSLQKASDFLNSGENLTIILGPGVFMYSAKAELVDALRTFLKKDNVTIIPFYVGANTRGALEMGVFPEVLPGVKSISDPQAVESIEKAWNTKLPDDKGLTLSDIREGEKLKVLYLVGAHPGFKRPKCDFLIFQDTFEPDFKCDLYLPAASFLEAAGTLTNVEGRVQEAPRIEELPDSVMYGRARPDWWIFAQIAQKLGVKGFEYKSDDEIRSEIASIVADFPGDGKLDRARRIIAKVDGLPEPGLIETDISKSKEEFFLTLRPMGYTHRGQVFTELVEGLQILNPEDGLYFNSDDARELDIMVGELVTIKAGSIKATAPARIEPELMRGVIYLYVPDAFGGYLDRKGLDALFRVEQNPVPVEVIRHGV